jgi:transposase
MEKITLLGVDLAKEKIQVYAADSSGHKVFNKQIKRSSLLNFIVNLPVCHIAMEACSSSNYWGREFIKLGHTVSLISPQYVKPYVKTNKNDMADAEAIAEAASRPNMRFVPIKQTWQQDIQSIHRVREQLIKNKTALSNEIRGFLSEFGFCIQRGYYQLCKRIPLILEDADNKLSGIMRRLVSDMYEELKKVTVRIEKYDAELENISKESDICKRLEKIPGIGPKTSTSILYSLGHNASAFKNGRQFSAYLGLVPRQHSSGGKDTLLGISKRGDCYVRKLLVHGARSVLVNSKNKEDKHSKWIYRKKTELGMNKASVALANKNARIIWALIKNNSEYKVVS